ncbi:hypothetical protein H0H92_000805 [Tricholoma furcatifolium]|nr:hypothetical protein H0H92_000805 [Tricholoma furcatifolium]
MADITAAEALAVGADAVFLQKRPLPDAPTGYYDWQITTDPSDDVEGHSALSNLIRRARAYQAKGGFKPKFSELDAFHDTIKHPTAIDDRKGSFAAGLGILARLDPKSDLSKTLNDHAIDTLYNTVPHPPTSFLGPRDSFRQADGGGNNLENSDLGRAGTPYSRSVEGKAGLPRTSLPDPGLIFDAILKRKGVRNHAGGMSSLIFAFASIVTHSLFRTDRENVHNNNASSYLDLSPLYGDNQTAQDKFIAQRLLKINEKKPWSDPVPVDPHRRAQQDEEIFQTAKLINCGYFMSAIMGDYVAGFLGSSEGWNWNMNAFDIIDSKKLQVSRGQGNHVSVEFNLLYRWHSTMSEKDVAWTENVFKSIFGDKPVNQLSLADLGAVAKIFSDVAPNPAERTFAGLKRRANGTFDDDDLAQILHDATEEPAGAFRGSGTPSVLRLVEIMGIEQSRAWGVCTMNEFRKFLKLKPFEKFEDWNPDPEIAGAARRLYGHVDNLELYASYIPAKQLCLLRMDFALLADIPYTTRAILADAVALVRGDRFYTSSFTRERSVITIINQYLNTTLANNLTTWGFYDCQRDPNNGAGGAINMLNVDVGLVVPKLLLRHLPRHFPWHMKESLHHQKLEKKYTFDRPKVQAIPKILNTFTGIKTVLNDPSHFKIIYEKHGYGSILMFDEVAKHDKDRSMVLHALFPTPEALGLHVRWVGESIVKQIKAKTWKYPGVPGNYVDIVKDVINIVSAHVSSDKLTGIDLKTKENPSGMFTENEFFDMLTTLYTEHVMLQNIIGKLAASIASYIWPAKKKGCYPFQSSLTATGRPIDEILGNIHQQNYQSF